LDRKIDNAAFLGLVMVAFPNSIIEHNDKIDYLGHGNSTEKPAKWALK
jgi:hypothetical protein